MSDQLKSAKLTSEWENELARIAKGESDAESFMAGIRGMVSVLISENKEVYTAKAHRISRNNAGCHPARAWRF